MNPLNLMSKREYHYFTLVFGSKFKKTIQNGYYSEYREYIPAKYWEKPARVALLPRGWENVLNR